MFRLFLLQSTVLLAAAKSIHPELVLQADIDCNAGPPAQCGVCEPFLYCITGTPDANCNNVPSTCTTGICDDFIHACVGGGPPGGHGGHGNDGPPPGAVTCPGQPADDYCDCGGDCHNPDTISFCSCAAAQACCAGPPTNGGGPPGGHGGHGSDGPPGGHGGHGIDCNAGPPAQCGVCEPFLYCITGTPDANCNNVPSTCTTGICDDFIHACVGGGPPGGHGGHYCDTTGPDQNPCCALNSRTEQTTCINFCDTTGPAEEPCCALNSRDAQAQCRLSPGPY